MTAIVGIAHRGQTYLAGDRAISGDDALVMCPHPKVWKRGGLAFGVAGSLEHLQRVRYQLKVPRFRAGQDLAKYCGRSLAPALRKLFPDDSEIALLVGARGKLFYFDPGFSFCDVSPEWAVGSGGVACRASLKALTGGPEGRALGALEIASDVLQSVSGPFDVCVC